MDDDSRYGITRGFCITLCVLLICFSGFRSCSKIIQKPIQTMTAPPPNFQRRFCDDATVLDYSKKNEDRINIPLKEGCYGPRVILPEAWQSFEVQKSQNSGDYLTVWCNGHANPGPIVPFYTAGFGGGLDNSCFANMDHSANFYVQGKELSRLFALSRNSGRTCRTLPRPR